MSEGTLLSLNEKPSRGVLLPKDLDEWVIIRTADNGRFVGRRLTSQEADHSFVKLEPAYEYLYSLSLHMNRNELQAPMRLLVPLELMPEQESVHVRAVAIMPLREASSTERKVWLDLIDNAEKIRSQIALQMKGVVSANADALNGLARGARRG